MATTRTPSVVTQQPTVLAPNMRSALRKLGLDRQSTRLRFTKRSVTADVADFGMITSTSEDGTVVTLENLVIRRSTIVGPAFGQFTIEGTKLVGTNGLSIGGFSLVGIRGGDGLAGLIGNIGSLGSTSAPNDTPAAARPAAQLSRAISVDRLTMRDFVTRGSLNTNQSSVSAGEISLSNLALAGDKPRFQGLTVKNFAYGDSEAEFRVGSLQLSEVGPDAFALLERPRDGTPALTNLLKFTLGGLTLSDVSMTFKAKGSSPAALNSFGLEELSIGETSQGFVKSVRFSGVKLAGVAGRHSWQMALKRVGMTGINLAYLSEVGDYVNASIKAALASSNKQVAEHIPSRPRRVLKDLLPGGPLDSGFSSFDLAELNVTGGGFTFDIDQIGFKQERDSQGIVTRADFVPTQIRLVWPQVQESGANPVAAMMSAVDSNDLVLRFSVASSFEPTTDRLRLESYRFEIQDWGSFNLGFTMSGLDAFMAKTSFSDFAQLTTRSANGAAKKPRTLLNEMLQHYSGITINAGQIEIADLGGIDKAVRLTGNSSRRPSATTPADMTQDQIRETRLGWAQKPRALAGDKTKPALERRFNIAFARWIENGGSVTMAMEPTTPIGMSDFNNPAGLTAERLGLRITNQAP